MATRSTIALEFADGTVDQIYAHWDGYLSHNGRILLESYMDPFKVQQLIELGSLSVLTPEIGVKHPFDNPHRYGTVEHQAFKDEFASMCVFYCRDRGEDLAITRLASFSDYEENGQREEYNYIMRNIDGVPTWFVMSDDTEGDWVIHKNT